MLSSCGLILRCSLCCPPGLPVRGRALLHPPLFFSIILFHGTTQKTKPHDVEVARETSWPFFGFWTSGSDASGHGAQVPALL